MVNANWRWSNNHLRRSIRLKVAVCRGNTQVSLRHFCISRDFILMMQPWQRVQCQALYMTLVTLMFVSGVVHGSTIWSTEVFVDMAYTTAGRMRDLFSDVIVKEDVQLEAVVSPRTELHLAALHVERKVADVDGAGWPEDGRRQPQHLPVVLYNGHCVAVLLKTCIGAEKRNIYINMSYELYYF